MEMQECCPNPAAGMDPASSPQAESPPAALLAAFASAAALAACGGGGGGGAPAPASVPAPPAVAPAQAARFLQQAQFSSTDAQIASVQAQGYAAWLDQQFSAPASITGWDWLMSKGYNSATYASSTAPADFMVWMQLISSADALRKRVALALSEIFVVSSNGINVQSRSFAMAAWWDLLAANAFGSFRTLLEAVTLNPAMGVYLNTKGNQKDDAATGRQPDENYGREVMQLFTIGLYQLKIDGTNQLDGAGKPVETYDLTTVTNIARAFTGWDFDSTGATAITNPLEVRNPMTLIASRHSALAANFLGATIAAGTDGRTALKTALDTLANHPNAGPFFCKQLIQRLVTSNPSPAYVTRIATVFNNNGSGARGDLKAVLRALLLDDEARNDANLAQPAWGKLREPMVRFVQWARSFNALSSSGNWQVGDLSNTASRLGQSPLRSGSVFNFFRPGYIPPNTALAASGLVAPEFQIANESTVAAWINFMQTTVANGYIDLIPDYSAELALAGDAQALVDRLNLVLAAGQLSAATVATIRNAVAGISASSASGPRNRVQAAVLLVLAAPEYIAQK